MVLRLPFTFLIFNVAFLHSGATARDLHPLPYSPRSFARGTRTLLSEKNKGNNFISFLIAARTLSCLCGKSQKTGRQAQGIQVLFTSYMRKSREGLLKIAQHFSAGDKGE
jgi:hypothetical protein